MEIAEVFELSDWYLDHGPRVAKLYQQLLAILKHNASQAEKKPVQEALDDLISGLKELPIAQLSLQQVEHLDNIGVGFYLGIRGAEFVESVVTRSSYDPATSASEIKTAADKVASTASTFQNLVDVLKSAAFVHAYDKQHAREDVAVARIQFRQDASIGNIAEMKKWSADWNDIARGIGHLVGETPQDMKVVSASKGSIVVCVTGSLMLISAFAFMSKRVSGIVLDALRVQNAIEDLRHKKISNDIIEKSMKDDLKKRESALQAEIVKGLKDRADNFAEEHDAHLETAVKKYINFSKRGGEVDYLQPPEPDDAEDVEEHQPEEQQVVDELRELISQIRSIKSETLLLEDRSDELNE